MISKLIVALSLGSSVTFKWKAKSCSDSEVSLCQLHHGDLLVMDGRCQDEYLHCTSPGLADRRVNITYRWIRNHTSSCPFGCWSVGVLTYLCAWFTCLGTCLWGSSWFQNLFSWGCWRLLVCGLLFVLSSLAFRKTDRRGLFFPFWLFCPLGMNGGLWGIWPPLQESWGLKGRTGWVECFSRLRR